jgi:hypothetical protein
MYELSCYDCRRCRGLEVNTSCFQVSDRRQIEYSLSDATASSGRCSINDLTEFDPTNITQTNKGFEEFNTSYRWIVDDRENGS